MKTCLYIDGIGYDIEILQPVRMPVNAPRLLIVSYLPNLLARQILHKCIQTIQQYTANPYELWVVDNNSPTENTDWLRQQPHINVILNYTDPVPPSQSKKKARLGNFFKRKHGQKENFGSYANALALELAVRVIDPKSHYLMTLHMDTMPCHTQWLRFLQSKISEKVAIAGVRMDTGRTKEGVLHVLGYMVNFQIFRQLDLNFLPQLPAYDVGDLVTVNIRKAGYTVYACHNTLWEPELVENIPLEHPLRTLHVDRSFDDDGNVIFLHLGRGIRKSSVNHNSGASVQEWLAFADDHLLTTPMGEG